MKAANNDAYWLRGDWTKEFVVQANPLRILLVDDDPVIRDCFPAYFAAAPDLTVAGVADDGLAAQEWLRGNRCEIVLSDIQMPEVNGIALLRWVKQLPQPPLFVAMTAFDTDRSLIATLTEGAVGYVVKSQRPHEIIEAIRAAAHGNLSISAQSGRRLLTTLRSPEDKPAEVSPDVSDEERQLLHLISRGYTNRRIGGEMNYAEVTVKKKVSALLRKFGAQSRAELAALARELP